MLRACPIESMAVQVSVGGLYISAAGEAPNASEPPVTSSLPSASRVAAWLWRGLFMWRTREAVSRETWVEGVLSGEGLAAVSAGPAGAASSEPQPANTANATAVTIDTAPNRNLDCFM